MIACATMKRPMQQSLLAFFRKTSVKQPEAIEINVLKVKNVNFSDALNVEEFQNR